LDDSNRDNVLHAEADNGMAPLHLAAFNGKVEHLMLLLATAPGNIDAKSIRGLTPLMLAVAQGHADATALLIWNLADTEAKDDEGFTAHDYAKDSCPACMSLLVSSLFLGETTPWDTIPNRYTVI
jgi:ankyrin repeat protein